MIGGHLFIWERGAAGAVQEDWRRNVAAAGQGFRRTPFDHMMRKRKETLRVRLTEEASPFPMLDRFREEGGSDYFAVQAFFGGLDNQGPASNMIASWLTDAPDGFDAAQLALITRLVPALALAIKGTAAQRIVNSVIATYLGEDAGRRVLGGTIERGAGETIRAALWSSDLMGFTKLSDRMARDQLLGLLHDYFEATVEAIQAEGGEVLKFMGDGLLAIFHCDDDRTSCGAALAAADGLRARLSALDARRQAGGLPTTRVYLGLHLGDALYGNIGAPSRLDFTVIGPAVNEVSRIEAMCRALDQDLVISAAFAQAAADSPRLASLGRYVLRGVRKPQELFTLVAEEDL